MNTISKKYIVGYITESFGPMRHDADAFVKAIRKTSKDFDGLNKVDLFHYIIERAGTIPMATSYGFDTAYGRSIRECFKSNYYEAMELC